MVLGWIFQGYKIYRRQKQLPQDIVEEEEQEEHNNTIIERMGMYAALAPLEPKNRWWALERSFLESYGEYMARLYKETLSALSYLSINIPRLKETDPKAFDMYEKVFNIILKEKDLEKYKHFLIGLRNALELGFKEEEYICYILLATEINLFIDFLNYMKPKALIYIASAENLCCTELDLSDIIFYLKYHICNNICKYNSKINKFLECINNNEKKKMPESLKYERYKIIDFIKGFLYYLGVCEPPQELLKIIAPEGLVLDKEKTKEEHESIS